jgi:hypothetical protein
MKVLWAFEAEHMTFNKGESMTKTLMVYLGTCFGTDTGMKGRSYNGSMLVGIIGLIDRQLAKRR